MNGCGRAALICTFSCEPSVSGGQDWIMRAERQCSRAHRIEISKLQDWCGGQVARSEQIQRFTAAASMTHESPTPALLTNKAKNECAQSTAKTKEIWQMPCQRCCTRPRSNTEWRSGVNVSILRHVIQMLSAIYFDKNATTRLYLSLQRRISETRRPRKCQCSHMRPAMRIPPQLTLWGLCVENRLEVHLIESPQKRSARNEHVYKKDFKEDVFA